MSYEVQEITLLALVCTDSEANMDEWDWTSVTDCAWSVPRTDSWRRVAGPFETEDAFWESLTAGGLNDARGAP